MTTSLRHDDYHDDRGASTVPLLSPTLTKTLRDLARQEHLHVATMVAVLVTEALQARRLRGAT